MAAKPATVPTWDTNATNSVAPSAGHRTDGWEDDEVPTAGVANHEANLIGQWCQYLNDGQLSGDHEIDGDLHVTGDVSLDGDVTSALNATSTITATGLITANAGVAAGANQNIGVSGTGKFTHGDKTKNISSYNLLLNPDGGAWALQASGVVRGSGFSNNHLIVPFEAGQRIKSFSVALAGTGTCLVHVYTIAADGTVSASLGNRAGGVAGTLTTYTIDITDTTIQAGMTVMVTFQSNLGDIDVGNMWFTYDCPP